ncbi:XRE family transcriptional regulator [Leuconostoc falkenbergense]|uniref:XRE family transcriptional regulator n=1 Tax=Leuconostoc falkenbergense TaxID=2766470 RepID=A0A9X3IQS5_9LACO|nr:helix-turn-helix transcriptional regulator [Leuconostoc falkenbergense]MCX7579416.1 XRE family transcriptional regulator [Leuconostoc falkenbergense]
MWNKIQKQLEIQNKTAYWLAKKSGIPIQTIYSLRNNDNADTSFHNMERIANALDVSLDEFRTKKNA